MEAVFIPVPHSMISAAASVERTDIKTGKGVDLQHRRTENKPEAGDRSTVRRPEVKGREEIHLRAHEREIVLTLGSSPLSAVPERGLI